MTEEKKETHAGTKKTAARAKPAKTGDKTQAKSVKPRPKVSLTEKPVKEKAPAKPRVVRKKAALKKEAVTEVQKTVLASKPEPVHVHPPKPDAHVVTLTKSSAHHVEAHKPAEIKPHKEKPELPKHAEQPKKHEHPVPKPQEHPSAKPPVQPPAPVKPAVAVHAPAVHPPQPAVAQPQPAVRPVQPVVHPPQPSVQTPVAVPAKKELELKFPVIVKDLAIKLQDKPSVIIKSLMSMGVMAGINNAIGKEAAQKICDKYGYILKEAPGEETLALAVHNEPDLPGLLTTRAPIVTLMGHVDHGKTSLLDCIRKSKVAESEHGGITQHIGAYRVRLAHGEITFLDTPGHEAFTAMRGRGARITDIVVLVVAADDGIMPQTQEAIDHAKAAGVSIIVALNKIDKPQADPDKVKKQLSTLGLLSEDWGGKTIIVPVSAKTGQGIDELLEMILLEAQMLELKANPKRLAKGVVVEGEMVKNKGPVVTLLVQNGTLHLNDNIIVGLFYGKIRAMFNDNGHAITQAGPGYPVEVLGISGIPPAGEQFFAMEDEKTAKELAAKRQEAQDHKQRSPIKRMGLEDLYSQIKEGKLKELKLVLKADMQGSLEAIKDVLGKIESAEIKLNIIHGGIGSINASDVLLAMASDALILGFHVQPDDQAKDMISKEGLDVRTYNIIYELGNDIKAALEGMLEPKLKRIFLGRAEIRKVFTLSRSGVVAGSFVVKGKINRGAIINLVRNGEVVYEGELSGLKRFKDDVREVEEGFECGITLKNFDAIQQGDLVEAYQIEKIARKLS